MCHHILLSIIIPVYNVEQYLPKCLESLQVQHFPANVEIILIDDGSTDKSGQICDEFAAENAQYRIFHIENRGVAAARNRGLKEARGEYIAWVDPDDYITDDWWKVIEPVLAQKPDMICFDKKMMKPNGLFNEWRYDNRTRPIPRMELIQSLVINRIPSFLYSKILNRRFYDNCQFDESLKYYEDYNIMHRLTFSVRNCVYLCKYLYVYQYRENSLMNDKTDRIVRSQAMIEEIEKRIKFYCQHGITINEYPIAKQKLKFLCDYMTFTKNNINTMINTFPTYVQDIKKYQNCFYFNKELEMDEQCLLYILFRKKKPLLWAFIRHPIIVISEIRKFIAKA